MNSEIQAALGMARAYADFAPGRLVRKQMEAGGDACYESLLKQEMTARFLFPQLAVDKSDKEKSRALYFLMSLMDCAEHARTEPGDAQKLKLHRLRWQSYLKSEFANILTPFQLDLIKESWSCEE